MARGVFGDLFDYDRDGELDPAEQSFEFAFMEQQEKEAPLDDYRDNPLGLDPDDFDSPEEFLDAYEEKDAWVDAIDIDESILADELFIDPADYDSYEEFHDALVEAQELNKNSDDEDQDEDPESKAVDFNDTDLTHTESKTKSPDPEDDGSVDETQETADASPKNVIPDKPLSPSSWQDAFSVGALYQGILYRERDEVSVRSFPLKGYSALIRVGAEPAYDVHLILHGPRVHSMQCRCRAAQRNKLCEHMAAAMFAYSGNARIRVTTPEEKAYLRETFPGFTKEAEKLLLTPDPMPEPTDEADRDLVSEPVPDAAPSPVPAETVSADESDSQTEAVVFDPGIEIREPKRRSLVKWIVALVILAAVVVALVMYARQMRTVHVQQCYTSAELYIAAGEYRKAIDELDAIKNTYHTESYLDSVPLRDLCEAHIELNSGHSQKAFDLLANKPPFQWQSADFIRDYNDFVHEVEDAHNQDLAKQQQKELEKQQKAAARKAEFREELKHRLPYIGMDESYINDTSLGKYDKADIGKTYSYYTFYTNSSSYYYVTCENGKVISANQFSRSTSSGNTSKSSSTKKSDPYDVYDYSDPDDFFYDHYDEFDDYEEAEDYYYDHVR